MRSFVAIVVALCSFTAVAGPLAAHKAVSKRAEAQQLVEQVLRGEGNFNAAVSRLTYLGEQGFACSMVTQQLHREVDADRVRVLTGVLQALAHPCAESSFVGLLSSTDGATRMAAVQGLGKLKSGGPALVPLLQDPSLGVRREVARALAAAQSRRYAMVLMRAAKTEGEPEVRAALLLGVGASQDLGQRAGLEPFLTHSSQSARFAAASALCRLGSSKGYQFVRTQLGSADPLERLQALGMLEGQSGKQVVALLEPLAADPEPSVAALANRLLYQSGKASALDQLVLLSFHSEGDARAAYERELEPLRLEDGQRQAILKKAGIQ